jgi:hypothetical protein
MDAITASGYGVTATLTSTHLELVASDAHNGGLLVPLEQIRRVDHAPPRLGGLVNGHVVVHTVDGDAHEMHYTTDHTDFAALVERLVAATS